MRSNVRMQYCHLCYYEMSFIYFQLKFHWTLKSDSQNMAFKGFKIKKRRVCHENQPDLEENKLEKNMVLKPWHLRNISV